MSYNRHAVKVLILELATMVVAIAIAFGASFLTTFEFDGFAFGRRKPLILRRQMGIQVD